MVREGTKVLFLQAWLPQLDKELFQWLRFMTISSLSGNFFVCVKDLRLSILSGPYPSSLAQTFLKSGLTQGWREIDRFICIWWTIFYHDWNSEKITMCKQKCFFFWQYLKIVDRIWWEIFFFFFVVRTPFFQLPLMHGQCMNIL